MTGAPRGPAARAAEARAAEARAAEARAAEAPVEPAADGSRRSVAVLVLAAVVAGVALRVWILASPLGHPDADEAVVGFMAQAMRDGALPVFYWGQNHGGTAEPALVATLFTFGASNLTLKLAPILLSALTAVLVWRVGRRLLGEPAGALAGALFLVYPPAFVWWSTKERGFYWAGAVLGGAVLLQALRLVDRMEQAEAAAEDADSRAGEGRPNRRVWRETGALGLLVGLAWWTSPQTMYTVVPVLSWFAWRSRRSWRQWWPAAPSALAGASPWLVWNAAHDWASLHEATPAVASTYPERLRGFFTDLLPEVLGVKVPVSGDWLFGPVGSGLYLAALAGFGWYAAGVVRDPRLRRRAAPLLVIALSYPFLFSLPGASVFTGEPRYGLMLAPVVVLLAASVLSGKAHRVAAVAVAVVLGVATVGALVGYAEDHPRSVDLAPADLAPLEAALDDLGVDRVYADYWIAYPLAFESGERYVATPVDFVRVARLHELVDAAVPSTYVVFEGSPRDVAFAARLDGLGVGYRRVTAGQFAVFALDARLRPGDVEDVWRQPGL